MVIEAPYVPAVESTGCVHFGSQACEHLTVATGNVVLGLGDRNPLTGAPLTAAERYESECG